MTVPANARLDEIMIGAAEKMRLEEMCSEPDRGPDRQRQHDEDGDCGGQGARGAGRGRCDRGRAEIVETRDMTADVEQGEDQFECEKPHGQTLRMACELP